MVVHVRSHVAGLTKLELTKLEHAKLEHSRMKASKLAAVTLLVVALGLCPVGCRDAMEETDRGMVSESALENNVMKVEIAAPGYSAEGLEADVLPAVSESLASLNEVRWVIGECQPELCRLTVHLRPGADPADAQRAVAAQLEQINLPPSCEDPRLFYPPTHLVEPMVWLTLEYDESADRERIAESAIELRNRIERTAGVAEVRTVGFLEIVTMVTLDYENLRAFAVTPADIVATLKLAEIDTVDGELDADGLAERPISNHERSPTLGSVALVRQAIRSKGAAFSNDRPAIAFGIQLEAQANLGEFYREMTQQDRVTEWIPSDEVELTWRGPVENQAEGAANSELRPIVAWLAIDLPVDIASDKRSQFVRKVRHALASTETIHDFLLIDNNPSDFSEDIVVRVESRLEEAKNPHDWMASLSPALNFPGAVIFIETDTERQSRLSLAGDLEMSLVGPQLDQLARWAQSIRQRILDSHPQVRLRIEGHEMAPRLNFRIRRDRAAEFGVGVREIEEAIALSKQQEFSFPWSRTILEVGSTDREQLEFLTDLVVRNNDGEVIPLTQVVEISVTSEPQRWLSLNGRRMVRIAGHGSAQIGAGELTSSMVEMAEEIRAELGLNDEYQVRPMGLTRE